MWVFKTNIDNIEHIKNNVHKKHIFITLNEIDNYKFLPADYLVLDKLIANSTNLNKK